MNRVVLAVVITLACLSGCSVQHFLMRKALAQQSDYFHTPESDGMKLTGLTSRVWTFNDAFDRTLVVDTDDGLVIVDPFSKHLASGLKEALAREGLVKPVHTLVYTHYHLDHVRGGAALAPKNVVAHERCPAYWKDFDTSEIVPPTQLVSGDTELTIGGVPIRLVYLGRSHTDTLLAVHLPSEGVLYAADTVGVRVFLPVGGIALYLPGYFQALDRLSGLEFKLFVGSHFGWGTKQDFLDAVGLQRDIRDHVRAAMRNHTGPLPAHLDEGRILAIFDEVYEPLMAKYGGWHGFDAQVFASFINAYVGEFVGN